MDHEMNGSHFELGTTIKSPVQVANLSTFQLEPVTITQKIPLMEHVDTTDLRSLHDCFSRLGYGDLSDVVTQTMIGAIIIGVLLLLIIQFLFIHQMPYIFRHTPSKYLARTLMLCGIYTIIGSAAFVALIAYRAYVFCDSVCHFAFLLCAYQYFTLLIDYVDGESNFIKNSSGVMVFNIQTPPLCCCLRFLQPTEITKDKFKTLRLMILQMPIVQGILLALLNVFNSIETQLYDQMQPFISIFIVMSILIGVWSLQITSRMIAKHLPEHRIMQKYFAIQLVLILYKLQPAVLNGLSYSIYMLADYQINSKIIQNAIIQLIILLETAFLSYFANHAYSLPTKAYHPNLNSICENIN